MTQQIKPLSEVQIDNIERLIVPMVPTETLAKDTQELILKFIATIRQLQEENKRLNRALKTIASCEIRFEGDIVHIAREALKGED